MKNIKITRYKDDHRVFGWGGVNQSIVSQITPPIFIVSRAKINAAQPIKTRATKILTSQADLAEKNEFVDIATSN